MKRCHKLEDGTFIPGCIGAAARGPEYCTCGTIDWKARAEAAESLLREIESTLFEVGDGTYFSKTRSIIREHLDGATIKQDLTVAAHETPVGEPQAALCSTGDPQQPEDLLQPYMGDRIETPDTGATSATIQPAEPSASELEADDPDMPPLTAFDGGPTRIHRQNANLRSLVDEYIALLTAEIEELIPYAVSHGWKSTRSECGAELRAAMDAAWRASW